MSGAAGENAAGGARVLAADVGIVGAGPGGLAAALALARAGMRVAVLDEGPRAGGQIFRQPPPACAPPPAPAPPSHRTGHRLLDGLARSGVRHLPGAVVWDAAPGHLWFERDGASCLLRCGQIVLATGAFDRCLPFPGWTLPGVITAGAAQVMVRGFGVRPGARALVAGSGPLLLPTVTALCAAGVRVVAALEAAPRRAMLRALPALLRSGARLREAWFYLRALGRAGVGLRWGRTVFAALGTDRVERAVIGRVDAGGRPLRQTARTIDVDVVCTGFGLVPATELAQRLGCAVRHDPVRGGHCVVVDERQRTTVADVFAVGEVAGVGGAEVAMAEGEVAAAAILGQRQRAPFDPALARRRDAQRRAADALLRSFVPRAGLFGLPDGATVVCRCEDVTLQQARDAAALHGDGARGIKMGCRAGMGPCQGRMCMPNLQALVAGRPVAADEPVVQVPVKPVAAATLLDAPEP